MASDLFVVGDCPGAGLESKMSTISVFHWADTLGVHPELTLYHLMYQWLMAEASAG